MSDLDPAVEAIVNVLHTRDCGDRCEPHTYAATYLPTAEVILTAAAPLIAAQATADLRARIEALRGLVEKWRTVADDRSLTGRLIGPTIRTLAAELERAIGGAHV